MQLKMEKEFKHYIIESDLPKQWQLITNKC
jgi:hypothetical protein